MAGSLSSSAGRHFMRITPDPSDIREHAPILVPLVIVVLMQTLSAWSIREPAAAALAADPTAAEAAEWLLIILLVFGPIVTLIKTLVLAALTWAILVLLSTTSRFRPILSIHMYGAAVLALSGVATAFVLRFRGGSGLGGADDLLVPMGLDLILDLGSSPVALAIVQHTSVFHVLWVVLVTWLLRRVTSMPGASALVATLVLWALGMGYAVLRTVLFAT